MISGPVAQRFTETFSFAAQVLLRRSARHSAICESVGSVGTSWVTRVIEPVICLCVHCHRDFVAKLYGDTRYSQKLSTENKLGGSVLGEVPLRRQEKVSTPYRG
jgi:hypothetical protein